MIKVNMVISFDDDESCNLEDLAREIKRDMSGQYIDVVDIQVTRSETETVVVAKDVYDNLEERSDFLSCLEACGVDNWSGYSDAKEMMEEDDESLSRD